MTAHLSSTRHDVLVKLLRKRLILRFIDLNKPLTLSISNSEGMFTHTIMCSNKVTGSHSFL